MNTTRTKGRKIGVLCLFFLLVLALFGGFWRMKPEIAPKAAETKEARVTGVSYGEGGANILIFNLSGMDYPTVDGSNSATFNSEVSYDRLKELAFFEKIAVDGIPLASIYDSMDGSSMKYYINFWQKSNTFALHLPGYSSSADLKEIVVEQGCEFPAYDEKNGAYTVAEETRFEKEGGVWKQKIRYATTEISVNGITFGEFSNYLFISLDGTDYPPNGADPTLQNYKISESVVASMDFLDKIRIDGLTLRELYAKHSTETYRDYVLNLFQVHGRMAFPIPGYSASNRMEEIVVEEGCQFPSYEYVKNGGTARCFMTTKEVVGVRGSDASYTIFEGCDSSKPAVLDDSITGTITSEGYQFDIRFNRTGEKPAAGFVEDTIGAWVQINGVTLAEINAEEKYVTAQWQYIGGRYYLRLVLSADYDGDAWIVNEDYYFAGNSVRIDEELTLPSGEKAGKSFLLHLYRTNSVTEIIDEDLKEETIYVENISAGYDVNGDFNIWITFSQEISAGMRLFLASPDSFGKTQLKPMNSSSLVYYDDELSKNFISGGYKSALLDNILVNGVSIGEWLAYDQTPGYLTAVMVHYGQVTQKTMSIVCDLADDGSWATDIFYSATDAYKNGGLSVTVREGMRFPTGKRVVQDAEYVYANGDWKTATDDFGVYYAGQKTENGGIIHSQVKANADSLSIVGNGTYTVQEDRVDNVVRFIVRKGEEKVWTIYVREEIESAPNKKGGCASNAQGTTAAICGLLAAMCVFGRRRREDGNA